MKMSAEVIAALQVLKDNAENELDRLIIERCERDLAEPPEVKIIGDYQTFLGLNFKKKGDGYYDVRTNLYRLVYAYYYGGIPDNCVIHHKNGDKSDNKILNLEAVSVPEHLRLHYKDVQKKFEKNVNFAEKFLRVIFTPDIVLKNVA